MSSILERLRRLHELRPPPKLTEPAGWQTSTGSHAWSIGGADARLEDLVPGEEVENRAGACYVSTQVYDVHDLRGQRALGTLLRLQPSALAPFHPSFALHNATDYGRAAFVDTETTGLGGGASVYCFMVGVGMFERLDAATGGEDSLMLLRQPEGRAPLTHFVVRQFFMRNPAEEGALLTALFDLLESAELSITFNGRAFDLPLLRARSAHQSRLGMAPRRPTSLLDDGQPHLDLLLPARRLWRKRLQSCRLIHLEQNILGLQRTQDDVPGYLIPQLYTEYLRHGDATSMSRVFYHNREDIVSMVALAERIGCAYGNPQAGEAESELHGLDWLALGHSYERLGQFGRAEAAYQRAVDVLRSAHERAEAFACLASAQKRQGRWQSAAETWHLWLTSIPGSDPTPYVELAKYCEWQLGDLEQAEMWTQWALHTISRQAVSRDKHSLVAELQHRQERLQRKRASPMVRSSVG